MKPLRHEDWAQLLRHLGTALELAAPQRQPWLDALVLDPPHLKATLRQLLQDRRAIETADFLSAGAQAGLHVAGGVLGPWRLLRPLGQGGMASVWLAERADGAHQRQVALKLPHRVFGSNAIEQRFLRERAILSTLQHPHIAQVLDAGSAAGQPWLALEYVAGQPITLHAAEHALDTRARLRLMLPVLQAVQHAHAQLVIHRDIKPANVMVDAEGSVKLLDFGVAKLLAADGDSSASALTQDSGRAMTPQYASPEQIAGRPLGVASDVYALGVLLHELLTHRLPYTLQRDGPAALEEAILAARVQRPSAVVADARTARALRGDIDTIVMKALALTPAQRYASAAALADDIQRHLAARPITARPARLHYRLGRWLQRHALAAGAAAAVLLALAAGLASTAWQAARANREARSAQATSNFLAGLFQGADVRDQTPEQIARTTALQLVDRGRARLATELADAPEARARLQDLLAHVYIGMAQATQALELRQHSVASWRALPGHSVELAQALMQLSTQELALDRDADAEAHAREGIALLQNERGEAADRERGNLHARLGDVLYRRQPALAEADYRAAVRLLGQRPVKDDEYPAALNGLAFVLLARGEVTEGITLLQTMRSERVARWGAQSMMVSTVDRDLAHFQYVAGQSTPALQTSSRVLQALRERAAPQSQELTTAMYSHALILQDLERHTEAAAAFLAAEAALAAQRDGSFLYRAGTAAGAASSLLELGHREEAEQAIARALSALGDQLPGHPIRTQVQLVQARLLAAAGRYDEATRLFEQLHPLRAQDPPFRSRGRAMIYVRQAEMALLQRQPETATALLAQARAAIQPASPMHQRVLDHIDTRLVQAALLQSRAADALALATTVLARQRAAAEPSASPALQADLERLMAQARAALKAPN